MKLRLAVFHLLISISPALAQVPFGAEEKPSIWLLFFTIFAIFFVIVVPHESRRKEAGLEPTKETYIRYFIAAFCSAVFPFVYLGTEFGRGLAWILLISISIYGYGKFRRKAVNERDRQAQQQKSEAIRRQAAFDELLERLSRQHAKTLLIKRDQLAVTDPYGNVDYSKFMDHLTYFIEKVIFRDFKEMGFEPMDILKDQERSAKIPGRIAEIMVEYKEQNPSPSLSDVRTGIEYESFCKNILETDGWHVLDRKSVV